LIDWPGNLQTMPCRGFVCFRLHGGADSELGVKKGRIVSGKKPTGPCRLAHHNDQSGPVGLAHQELVRSPLRGNKREP
jgi:hypothetical protein